MMKLPHFNMKGQHDILEGYHRKCMAVMNQHEAARGEINLELERSLDIFDDDDDDGKVKIN